MQLSGADDIVSTLERLTTLPAATPASSSTPASLADRDLLPRLGITGAPTLVQPGSCSRPRNLVVISLSLLGASLILATDHVR